MLGAAAMAAAGAWLFEPSLFDFGVYVERGKYALCGYALIYAAVLIAFVSTAGIVRTGNNLANYAVSLVFGPIALFGLGMLFGSLAADAFFFRDPPNYWVTLLFIPALLCFSASSLSEIVERRQTERDAEAAGRGSRGLAGFLQVALAFVLGIGAAALYVNVGYFFFYVLQSNLLEGNDIDLGLVGPALVSVIREVAGERWMFVAFMGLFGALLIYAFAGLVAIGERMSRGKRRELGPQDAAFVAQSASELEAYAEARGYTRDARRLLWTVMLPSLFLPMLLTVIVGFNLHNWVPRPYDPAVLDAQGWNIYERSMGAAPIAMMFAALLWGIVPNAIFSRLSRAYSEIAGWSGFATGQRSTTQYMGLLLQTGVLRADEKFDPGAFLRRINTMYEPYFLFPAVVLTFAAAILWHHDMSRYHVLTDTYAEVMDYWTLKKHRYPYDEISGVVLGCSFNKDGRAMSSYEIALPDGYSIDLFRDGAENHVADLARVDANIGPQKPRSFAMNKPLFGEAASGYDTECVELIAASLEEADAERFRTAFRVEDWHKARWEERTSAPK